MQLLLKKKKSKYEMLLQNVRLEIQRLKTLDALKVRIFLLTLIMEVKKPVLKIEFYFCKVQII